MTPATVDADVLRELDRLAEGARLPVIVEHVEPVEAGESGLTGLAARTHLLQADLLGQLRDLGVSGARGLVMANAVLAELDRAQIAAVARRDDVRRIRLDHPRRVTAGRYAPR